MKDINWDTLDFESFERLQRELGKETIEYGVSLYGKGLTSSEINEILDKIKD